MIRFAAYFLIKKAWTFFLSCMVIAQTSYASRIVSYADIAENAMKSVVNIRTKTYVKRDPSLDIYQFFMQGTIPKIKGTSSLGSGIIFNSKALLLQTTMS